MVRLCGRDGCASKSQRRGARRKCWWWWWWWWWWWSPPPLSLPPRLRRWRRPPPPSRLWRSRRLQARTVIGVEFRAKIVSANTASPTNVVETLVGIVIGAEWLCASGMALRAPTVVPRRESPHPRNESLAPPTGHLLLAAATPTEAFCK